MGSQLGHELHVQEVVDREDELEEVDNVDIVQERIELIVIELDSPLNAAADKSRLEAGHPELHRSDIT